MRSPRPLRERWYFYGRIIPHGTDTPLDGVECYVWTSWKPLLGYDGKPDPFQGWPRGGTAHYWSVERFWSTCETV